MNQVLTRAAILAASFLLSGNTAMASPEPDFSCRVLPHPLLQANGFLLGEYIYLFGDRVGLVGYPEPHEMLPQVVSGSGMRFSNGAVTFSSKGDQGFLELKDGTVFPCTAIHANAAPAAAPPVAEGAMSEPAIALGTVVRAAPDAGAARIGRLPENGPVRLTGETGVYYQDYQWFRIEAQGGMTGFAWGGTLCVDTEYGGILIDCRRHAGRTALQAAAGGTQGGGSAGAIAGRSLFGSIVRQAADGASPRTGSIPQGAPIQIIGETGSFQDGWQWVLVRHGGGQQGYVWGGTICTTGTAIAGVHDSCN